VAVRTRCDRIQHEGPPDVLLLKTAVKDCLPALRMQHHGHLEITTEAAGSAQV
jgi:hypothetical protein